MPVDILSVTRHCDPNTNECTLIKSNGTCSGGPVKVSLIDKNGTTVAGPVDADCTGGAWSAELGAPNATDSYQVKVVRDSKGSVANVPHACACLQLTPVQPDLVQSLLRISDASYTAERDQVTAKVTLHPTNSRYKILVRVELLLIHTEVGENDPTIILLGSKLVAVAGASQVVELGPFKFDAHGDYLRVRAGVTGTDEYVEQPKPQAP